MTDDERLDKLGRVARAVAKAAFEITNEVGIVGPGLITALDAIAGESGMSPARIGAAVIDSLATVRDVHPIDLVEEIAAMLVEKLAGEGDAKAASIIAAAKAQDPLLRRPRHARVATRRFRR